MFEVLPWDLVLGLGPEGARAGLPPGVFRLRRLRPAALHRRTVCTARRQGTMQAPLPGDPRWRIYFF